VLSLKCSFCKNTFRGTRTQFIEDGWNEIKMQKPIVIEMVACKQHGVTFKAYGEKIMELVGAFAEIKMYKSVKINARWG